MELENDVTLALQVVKKHFFFFGGGRVVRSQGERRMLVTMLLLLYFYCNMLELIFVFRGEKPDEKARI